MSLRQTLRTALRALRRRPGFTFAATIALALGIGANAALLAVLRGVLLRPLPLADPERLVVVWETQRELGLERMYASPPNVADWKQARSLAGLAAWNDGAWFLPGEDGPEKVSGAAVTADLLPLLGVRPALGSLFGPEHDRPGAPPVVILGHDLWQRRFGGDPAVVGRQVVLDSAPARVLGVLPSGFAFPPALELEGTPPSGRPELWVPLATDLAGGQRGARYLSVIARLREGATVDAAERELRTLAASITARHSGIAGWSVRLEPLRVVLFAPIAPALWLLLGGVLLVLLVACVNLAHLLLARVSERSAELSVRRWLGAGRASLAVSLLAEPLLLALAGGLAGLALGAITLRLFLRLVPADVPRIEQVRLDPGTAAAVLLLALLAGLLAGLPAVLRELRSERGLAAASPQARRRGLTSSLVVAELALSFLLLAAGALLSRSLFRLLAVDPGFRAEGVLTLRTTLPAEPFSDRPARADAYSRLEDAVAALPGVAAAGFVLELPLEADRQGTSFAWEGEDVERAPERQINITLASPGYFAAMGVPLLAGRAFGAEDVDGAEPVVLVNDAFARRYGGMRVLDRRLATGMSSESLRRIAGIVRGVRHDTLDREAFPTIYVPYLQVPVRRDLALAVRVHGEPAAASSAIVRALRGAVPEVAVHDVAPLEALVQRAAARPRFLGALMGAFAGLALVLSLLGVYGVNAYAVRGRTREIAVRLAVGATGGRVASLFLGETLRLALAALALGIAAVVALGGVVARFLFGVSPHDPVTLAAVAAALLAVALLGAAVPALRATRVPPRDSLR